MLNNYYNQFIYSCFSGMNEIKPFVVCIWCGVSKPKSVNDYLKPFVNELADILREGVIVNDHKINVSVRCFIADSPARAFIKG